MLKPSAVRSEALAKLARLSTSTSSHSRTDPYFVKLCEASDPANRRRAKASDGFTHGTVSEESTLGDVPMVRKLQGSFTLNVL